MSGIIICGVDKGTAAKYRCYCCGFESDDIEQFATSSCWPCSMGGNGDCANCLSMGVAVSKFDPGWWLRKNPKPRGKVHILRDREHTLCGLFIPYGEQTGGGSHDDDCIRCSRADERRAAS